MAPPPNLHHRYSPETSADGSKTAAGVIKPHVLLNSSVGGEGKKTVKLLSSKPMFCWILQWGERGKKPNKLTHTQKKTPRKPKTCRSQFFHRLKSAGQTHTLWWAKRERKGKHTFCRHQWARTRFTAGTLLTPLQSLLCYFKGCTLPISYQTKRILSSSGRSGARGLLSGKLKKHCGEHKGTRLQSLHSETLSQSLQGQNPLMPTLQGSLLRALGRGFGSPPALGSEATGTQCSEVLWADE